MADLLTLADIVLSRAGANAVFEFLALTKPAVLVPLPLSASRGDQIQNARYFEKKGYAIMVDQDTATADTLADAVALAQEIGLPALKTPYTMFEACAKLYMAGLRPVELG